MGFGNRDSNGSFQSILSILTTSQYSIIIDMIMISTRVTGYLLYGYQVWKSCEHVVAPKHVVHNSFR